MTTKTFNLTPKRLQALRFIQARPGVLASYLATQVLAHVRDDGSLRPMWSQAATRMGAGYAKALVNAGLVHADTFGVRSGWGRLTLTEKGMQALAELDAQPESLDSVLARCESALTENGLQALEDLFEQPASLGSVLVRGVDEPSAVRK